jgi:hypothetical protein
MEETILCNIQSKSDFLKTPEGQRLFGSENALNWFERNHRKALVDSGALIKVRGSWYRNRPKYDEKVLEIAQNIARKSLVASNESN